MAHESGEARIIAALRDRPPGLWPFIPAGYPDPPTTIDLLRRLVGLPIRGVELGIPFSDPIADGPVIQHAFSEALRGGVRVAAILESVARIRAEIEFPLLAMASASIVYRAGVESFSSAARDAGLDGVIVPDLSLEEAPRMAQAARACGLALPMLVAPTTPPDRRRKIAAAASGFLYYVAVQGVTGERSALAGDLAEKLQAMRVESSLPILVGFGVSSAGQVADAAARADGVIVGSAVVRRMIDAVASPGAQGDTGGREPAGARSDAPGSGKGGEHPAAAAAFDFIRSLLPTEPASRAGP